MNVSVSDWNNKVWWAEAAFVIIRSFSTWHGLVNKGDYFYCTPKGATDRTCVELRVKSIG